MASTNRGQPPACRQKVVHRTQVDKYRAKGFGCPGSHDDTQVKPSGACPSEQCHVTRPRRREEVRFGAWNVTGVRGREVELVDAMEAYKLDVLGVSETWLKKGEEVTIPGFKWVGKAGENESGKGGGVGFLIRDNLWSMVGEVVEVSSRVIGIYVKAKDKGFWLLQVYAPVNDAAQDVREGFWSSLRDEVEKRRRSAAVVIMGDVNGRVGAREEDWDVVGRYGEAVVNENGESCLELCRGSDLIVLNGWFPHKRVHRSTYVQRMVDRMDREAVLDYFIVSKELKGSVVDVRVKRGVEIGSYHHLVIMRMDKNKLGLAISKRWMRSMFKLRTEKLQMEDVKHAFLAKLHEKYVEQDGCSLEEEWSQLKGWIVETAEEVVGRRKCGGRGKS